MDYVLVILFYAAVILIVRFIVKMIVNMIKKSDDKRAEAARHPKTDAQKELVREVIAAIERDAPNFGGAFIYPSLDKKPALYATVGVVKYWSSDWKRFQYDFDSHGYFVGLDMAYILACQIADHFGGECRSEKDTCSRQEFYSVAGPSKLASEREQKRREELERQRIENLKHL